MHAEHPRQSSPTSPDWIGAYRVLAYLGEGGMGRVYKAAGRDGRLVAIKVVRPEYATVQEFRERFQSEVRNAARVPRYWTAEVLESDLDGEVLYMVTEFIHGRTLHTAVTTDGPWSGARLEQLGINTAAALDAIHRAGVLHRDLKPSNVMLSEAGPRVIDFGIARALDATSAALTATGEVVGTSGFIAPEVYQGAAVSPAADVFAWGGVMVFAATRRYPFGGGRWQAIALRVLEQDPDLRGLDGNVLEIVRDALSKDPAARPTAGELQTRLAGAPAPRPAPAPPPHLTPPHLTPSHGTPSHGTPSHGTPGRAPPTVTVPPSAAAGSGRWIGPAPGTPTLPPAHHPPGAAAPPGRRRRRLRATILSGAAVLLAAVAAVAVFDVLEPPATPSPGPEFAIAVGDQVTPGQPGRGAGGLTAAAGQDTYTFDADGQQTVLLTEVTCDGPNGQAFAPRWTLTGPSGADVGSGDLCRGGSAPFLLGHALPEDGTYRLTVQAGGQPEGTYGFRLIEPVAVPIGAEPVLLTDGAAGAPPSIDTPAGADVYQFSVERDTLLYFDTRSCGNGFAAEMELTGPDGPVTLPTPRFCDTGGAVDPGWQDLKAGQYHLVVRAAGTTGGQYGLWVGNVTDQTFPTVDGQVLETDQPAGAGRIEAPGHRDWYRLEGRQGDQVTFVIDRCRTDGGSFQTDLRGPDSTAVDDIVVGGVDCADGGRGELRSALPGDGVYELSVGGGGTDTVGTYRITLSVE